MTVENNLEPDMDDVNSLATIDSQSNILHQSFVSRLEPFLFISLIAISLLVLLNNGNPPVLLAILSLTGINLLASFFYKHDNPTIRLLLSIIPICVGGILYTFTVDPSNVLAAWFYLLIVYYAFMLPSPHHYICVTLVAAVFILSYGVHPTEGGIVTFGIRLSLMLALGVLMIMTRKIVLRSIYERMQLMNRLREARDLYAQQLEDRTTELQKEIQERKLAEARAKTDHQLLQTIINTFPSRLFVKDRQSRFTMVNQASLKRLKGEDDPESIVGKSDFDFYPEFAERTYADEQHLMETGEPIIDLEETTLDPDGVERHFLISKVPMHDPDTNEIVGLVGATTDVTSLKEAQTKLQETQESLRQYQLRLKALNKITLDLTRLNTLDELVYQGTLQAIQHLGFSRLNCWFLHPDDPETLIGLYWVNFEGKIVSAHDLSMPRKTFDPIRHILDGQENNFVVRGGPIFDISMNRIGDGDKAFTALLDGDKVVGVLYADNLLDQQPFTDSQVELLNLYGATLGVLFNRHHAQEALRDSEEEALQFQQQLKTLNEITIQLEAAENHDELCRQVILLGRDKLGFERLGIWMAVDGQTEMRRGMWGVDMDGRLTDERDMLIPVPKIEAQMVMEEEVVAITDMQAYNDALEEYTPFKVDREWLLIGVMWDGTRRIGWLYADNAITHQPLQQNQYELFRLYVATIGVLLSRFRTQEALKASEETALNFQQQLKNLNEITIGLNGATSLEELCKQAVELALEKFDFDRVGVWLTVENQPGMRRGMWGTDPNGNLRDERHLIVPLPPREDQMIKEGDVKVFHNENIYQSQPNVDDDVVNRSWLLTGLMWDGKKRIGWLYADNAINGMPYNHNIYELFRLYAATLGVLINRQYAEEALKTSEAAALEFQQQLKMLNEVTVELELLDSIDTLSYEAVVQAREKLGFDRMGIWLAMDEKPDMYRGSWGTDKHGNIVDERELELPIPIMQDSMKAEGEIIVIEDSTSCEMGDEIIDVGWSLTGVMGDSSQRIGWVSVDNAIHNQPLTKNKYELFRLYVATLSVLINRQRVQEDLRASEDEARNFQQQLKILNEVTLELESAPTLDDLCRNIVILGREKLGFDRLGVWLIMEDDSTMYRGTWGIDSEGNLRDERHLIMPIPDYQANMANEGDVITLRQVKGHPLDGYIDTIDWVLNGLVTDGQKRIGWISVDNALTNQPLTPNIHELFRLYVATIGLLYTRQIADDLLHEREIRYRAITEASTDIILIVNRDMVMTYVSPSLKVIMGIDPKNIIGRSVLDVIHKDNIKETQRVLQQCIQLPQLHTRINEFRVKHIDGHWVHMEAVLNSQIDDPVINGVLVSCRDLTQRLVAEEGKRIVERERERALVLRQFIGDISHDFRTPLSTISTTAYLLDKGNQDKMPQRVDMINQQVARLTNLIDNLNTITKLDDMSEVTMEKLDINSILQSITHYKSDTVSKKQLSIKLDLEANLPKVVGNTGLLRDAIYHVMDNAVQYCEEQDAIVVQSYKDFEHVVVQIADTGVGISDDDLPFIFDRLYRADKSRNTHTGGSGLGLAITRRIIDLHQGTIHISSELNEGTLVYIHIPYSESVPATNNK